MVTSRCVSISVASGETTSLSMAKGTISPRNWLSGFDKLPFCNVIAGE